MQTASSDQIPGAQTSGPSWIVQTDARVVVTGASGFVGSRVVAALARLGFRRIVCGIRRSGDLRLLERAIADSPAGVTELVDANLLSPADCRRLVKDAAVVYHLVAGRGKSFPGCFQGSVVTTRNLIDASIDPGTLRRFVNVSSLAVYSNLTLKRGGVLDETCPLEDRLQERHDAYVYGKLRQDDLVAEYVRSRALPAVTVRPGIVIGPGKKAIPGFVGLDTFGFFMHIGGGARLPLTDVDNCADAIALAGLVPGVEGQVFNIVDDEPPTSRAFLRRYKREVRSFRSVRVPYPLAYALSSGWERYALRSRGQLPPVFNRRSCAFAWRGQTYPNVRAKERLGWTCQIPMSEALSRYFEYQKNG